MKQLLVETYLFTPTVRLVESKNSTGNPFVEGILATAEVKNGNGRFYARHLWERELETYKESIQHRRALGELDHPESQVVNLKNVSHLITECWWKGNQIYGRIEIMPTPSGNILKTLIENNVSLGVSSRGMGSVKQIGETLEVQDDFQLLCWDFVSNPSNPGSWMNPVTGKKLGLNFMNESQNLAPIKDYSKAHSIIRDVLCSKGTCPII